MPPPDVAMILCDLVPVLVLHACGVGAGWQANEEDG